MKPIFKNTENLRVDIENSPVWLSRSCAVVAEVILFCEEDKEWYVLLGQRGDATPDFQGYWGLPCGYLDWDETLQEAVLREVYEECGLYLPDLKESKQYGWSSSQFIKNRKLDDELPWRVFSNPTGKQNISMHYEVRFTWRGEFPALSFENADEGEVAQLAWIKVKDAVKMELAFSHEKCLEMWMKEFLNN